MLRRFASDLASDFAEGELLTYANAMAFRMLFAAIPLVLAAVAILSFLGLAPVWTVDFAPRLQPTLGPAFGLVDGTVRYVLASRQGFWLTIGLALATWQLSSTARAAGDALDRLYGVHNTRRLRDWVGVSIAVSLGVTACLTVAAVVIYFGEHIAEAWVGPSSLARGGGYVIGLIFGGLLMLLAIALLLRYMPGKRVRWRFAGTGAAVTVVAWIVATAAFGAYINWVIDYGDLFGGLAVPFLLLFYLDLVALFFLIGVWLERRRHSGVDRPLQVKTSDTE